jgi:hypothetical protein
LFFNYDETKIALNQKDFPLDVFGQAGHEHDQKPGLASEHESL